MKKPAKYLTLELWFEMWEQLAKLSGHRKSNRPTWLYYQLRDQYSSRPFHNFDHIDECVRHWINVRNSFHSPWIGLMTLAFHDCVYDSRQSNNELKSAEAAVKAWNDVGLPVNGLLDQIVAGITVTDHRTHSYHHDFRLICDIDLMSLSVNWTTFIRNSLLIRQEYRQYTEEQYWRGRKEFFVRFLARPAIYQSQEFAAFEPVARTNMQQMIKLIDQKFPS